MRTFLCASDLGSGVGGMVGRWRLRVVVAKRAPGGVYEERVTAFVKGIVGPICVGTFVSAIRVYFSLFASFPGIL